MRQSFAGLIWNPDVNESDIEIDFGLDSGESFEPEPLSDDFDSNQPHIETMLGPIEPGALGMTVFAGSLVGIDGLDSPEPGAMLSELEAAYAIGLRSLVVLSEEITTDRELLRWIAARSPVHVVVLSAEERRRCLIGREDEQPSRFLILNRSDRKLRDHRHILLEFDPGEYQSLTVALHALPLALMEDGFEAQQIRQMLIDHPAAALTRRSGAII